MANIPVREVFLALLGAGLVLMAAEVFVPGGILGFFGILALLGACTAGFFAFPGYGAPVSLGIVALVGLVLVLWIRFFPKSRMGRRMTVEHDLHAAKATEAGLNELAGKTGEAVSELRPAGFALIGGRRVDVVTQGNMIARGARVVVVEVKGNRVVVAAAAAAPGQATGG